MQAVFEKIIEKLEKELKLADEEKLRCARENPLQFDSAKGYANGVANSIEIVKQEAEKFGTDIKAESNGWIPVDEELPKTDKYILLSFSNFSIPCVGRYEEDENGGAFYVEDDDETCVSQDMFVNAWMNLPAPYQPKGE